MHAHFSTAYICVDLSMVMYDHIDHEVLHLDFEATFSNCRFMNKKCVM